MKPSMKGALLSGVVFPGLGQIVFKEYLRGILLLVAVVAALAVITVIGVVRALNLLTELEAAGGPIDEGTISGVVNQAISPAQSPIVAVLLLLIAVCWIYATIDAYRLGKKLELEE